MDSKFLEIIYISSWIVFLIIGTTLAMIAIFSKKISPDTTPKGKQIYYAGVGFSVFITVIVIGGLVLGFARQMAGF